MSRIFWKLTWSGVRDRLLPAALVVLLAFSGSLILSLALQLRSTASGPWDATFAATRGPHIEVIGDAAALERAEAAASFAEVAGPYSSVIAETQFDGSTAGLRIEGRPATGASIDQPLVTDGRWLVNGGIVLERSFAKAIGASVGDTLVIRGRVGEQRVQVAGIAVTVTQERYPLSVPGLAWADPALLSALNGTSPAGGRLLLGLENPALADDVAAEIRRAAGPGTAVSTWTGLREQAMDRVAVSAVILRTFSLLMLVASAAIVPLGVAVGTATRAREFSRLKAVGFTRRSLALMLTAEALTLALAGAAAGSIAAVFAAPRLVHYQVELGGVPGPTVEPGSVVIPVAAIAFTVGVAAFATAWRVAGVAPGAAGTWGEQSSTRLPMMRVLELSRLPVSVVLGALSTWRRPRRAFLAAACLSLGFAAVVSALTMEATFDAAAEAPGTFSPPPSGLPGTTTPMPAPASDEEQLRPLVYQLTGALVLLGVIALGMTTLLGVVERSREFGIIRAIGASAREIALNVVSGSWAVALLAIVAGVPAGVALFYGAYMMGGGTTGAVALPSAVSLAVVTIGMLVLSAAAAALPARRAWAETASTALRTD